MSEDIGGDVGSKEVVEQLCELGRVNLASPCLVQQEPFALVLREPGLLDNLVEFHRAWDDLLTLNGGVFVLVKDEIGLALHNTKEIVLCLIDVAEFELSPIHAAARLGKQDAR